MVRLMGKILHHLGWLNDVKRLKWSDNTYQLVQDFVHQLYDDGTMMVNGCLSSQDYMAS